MKFNHAGIMTKDSLECEIDQPHLKISVSVYSNNPYGIQRQSYRKGSACPELVKEAPNVAFGVDDPACGLKGKK